MIWRIRSHLKCGFWIARPLAAISIIPTQVIAQTDQIATGNQAVAEVIVTATRRAEPTQAVPVTVSAVTGGMIDDHRAFNIREASRLVPGAYIIDHGARSGGPIIFRGLNADPMSAFDAGNTGGGMVATYVGEVPLYADFRLKDIDRVEFILGPQGPLYGAGTLAGAIRYIPNRPNFDRFSGDARTEFFNYTHGKGISYDIGMTVNLPFNDKFAFRGSMDYLKDQGFIDYPYVVTEPGLTNPSKFGEAAKREKDLNTDETLTARAALRFQPSAEIDANLSYLYQNQRTNGRQFSSFRNNALPVTVGKWESALRVQEPNKRINQLVALEALYDLGFAQARSISGYSTFKANGQRDQTDLLITLDPAFAAFPNLTAFSDDKGKQSTYTQEVRVTSKSGKRFHWLVGAFYARKNGRSSSREYTPFLDQFFVQYLGGVRSYPENLEYVAIGTSVSKELALYGDLGLEVAKGWTISAGTRFYDYSRRTKVAVDSPLLFTVFRGRDPSIIDLNFRHFSKNANGFTWKAGVSYRPNTNALVYANLGTGFRMGGTNTVPTCPDQVLSISIACALPSESGFDSDKTTSYEIGFKTQWFNQTLLVNGAAYYTGWKNLQIASVTQNGALPITVNGRGAETKGFELSAEWTPSSSFRFRAAYAYIDPQLTAASPKLIRTINAPYYDTIYLDGVSGDRLPGSPKHSGSIFAEYTMPLSSDATLALSYQFYAQSNVATTTGKRGGSYTLPGFAVHNTALSLKFRKVIFQLYLDNIFDRFLEAGVRDIPAANQVASNAFGSPVYVRRFGTFILPPRSLGIRVKLKL